MHFCGQGEQGLVLEDESGEPQLVSVEALVELFKLLADQVECVVLNACYSEVQARAIAQHIDPVIGITKAIGDRAAIAFAVSFYDALGAGRAIGFTFELGRNAMQMQGVVKDQIVAKRQHPNEGCDRSCTYPILHNPHHPPPVLMADLIATMLRDGS